MRKKIFKIMKWLFLGLIVIGAAGAIWNCICMRIKLPRIENAYGHEVEVDGKKMVVDIIGPLEENASTIVLLPGLGSPSPVLEFKPLAEELAKEYRMITVEPLGYGLSDQADTKRSVNNITEELHCCLQELGVEKYYLMAHSIGGLYSVYYANTYPDEIQGFIGIDSSVPKQNENEPINTAMLNKVMAYLGKARNTLGISRLLSLGNPERAIYADPKYDYTEEEVETFRILTLDTSYNRTVMDELNWVEKNLATVRDMKFPESVPVLNFVAEENCEIFPDWEKLHQDVIGNLDISEVVLFKGGHYLHFEKKKQLVEEIDIWAK